MDQKWTTVTLCSIGNFIGSADVIIMPIAIVRMTEQFKWDLYLQGWILSSFALGYMASQFIGEKATKKYGNKRVLGISVCLWSFSTMITPIITPYLFLLILSRILLGIGEGLGLPTIFSIFSNQLPVKDQPEAFTYLISAGHVGQIVAAITCPYLYWEIAFYLYGSLGILWLCVWVMAYKEDRREISELGDDNLPLITSTATALEFKKIKWTKFLQSWSFWAIYIAHFSMNWTNYIIMQWLPTYLTRYLRASKESVSLIAVPLIVNSLLELVSGRLADSLVSKEWSMLSIRRTMTFIGLFGPGISLLLFSTVNNLALAVIFVSLSMGLCAFNSAGHLSNHTDVAPNHATHTFAISNTIATLPGLICGPITAELVTQSHGRWFPVFAIAAAINFVGAMVYASQSKVDPVFL